MSYPTWVYEDLPLPTRDKRGLGALLQRWQDYRDTYQQKYEELVAAGWTFADTWEEIPKLAHAIELEFGESPGSWQDWLGSEWLPSPAGEEPGQEVNVWFQEQVANAEFWTNMYVFSHVPSGFPYSDEGITFRMFTVGRILVRMHQLLTAQCVENVLRLSHRGRPANV